MIFLFMGDPVDDVIIFPFIFFFFLQSIVFSIQFSFVADETTQHASLL